MYIKKILVIVLILGAVAMGIFSWYVYQNIFTPNTAFNNKEAHVYISSTMNFDDVVDDLSPLLKDIESFKIVAKKKGYDVNIKAGHYIITKNMSNNDIINTIRSKNIPVTIKFNNQERLENLAGHLSKHIEPDSLSLLNAMKDNDFITSSRFNAATALGMYIPNSYEVYWNTSSENFRDKMLAEYNTFWNEIRNTKAKKIGLSRDQVMSLAAVVQKETVKIDERPRVAGVYINRIKKGMLLQADPTVIYAKKLADGDFNQVIKRVLYRDLEIDSKYNTYKYTGVPPGPITMPDITAIDAVLNYEKHDYIFFVADVTNFGYHKFAKTLSQHNANKAAYVRWINSQGVNR